MDEKHSHILRELDKRWGVVPTSYSGRCDLHNLQDFSDRDLANYWKLIRDEATTGQQFSHRGWYHQLYGDFFKNKRILDIGSGFGIDGITFAESGAHVTFVDIVESNLKVIERICNQLGLIDTQVFHLSHLSEINRLDSDYDVILAMGSLHHAPYKFIKAECRLLLKHLKIGGRWIQLAYPESRWVKDGRPAFERWGVITDGEGTPWCEWYSLHKLFNLLSPFFFDVVLEKEFHNNNFIWFDLLLRGKGEKSGRYPSKVLLEKKKTPPGSFSMESGAIWQHRRLMAPSKERIEKLSELIGHPYLLWPYQWLQLIAFSLEFKPDLILEIGRGCGNSTCAFLEAIYIGKLNPCPMASVCPSDFWQRETLPNILPSLPDGWLDPLDLRTEPIQETDYKALLGGYQRILIYWAEDGFEIAQTVFSKVLLHASGKKNAVIVQGVSDTKFNEDFKYGEQGIWKGKNKPGAPLRIGEFESDKENLISILDFIERNHIPFHSPELSFHKDFGQDLEKMIELQEIFGKRLFSLQAHWHWFSLDPDKKHYTFPGSVAQSG